MHLTQKNVRLFYVSVLEEK